MDILIDEFSPFTFIVMPNELFFFFLNTCIFFITHFYPFIGLLFQGMTHYSLRDKLHQHQVFKIKIYWERDSTAYGALQNQMPAVLIYLPLI